MAKYKAYPEYKDSGVEWLGEIPSHWKTIFLSGLFSRTKRTGYTEKELLSVYRDHGVIPKSSRDDNNNKPSEDLSPYQLVQPNDLVMNKMKAWQGSIAISEYEGIVSPAYFVYHPNKTLFELAYPKYVHYLLRNPIYVTQYLSRSKGIRVNQWDLDPDEFRNIELLLPSKVEQYKIYNFLDHETAKIDNLIEKQQQLIELLKEKRQALISHAVTKGLNPDMPMKDSGVEWFGDVPNNWKIAGIKYISKIISGSTPKSDIDKYWNGDINWFTPSDLSQKENIYIKSSIRQITIDGLNSCGTSLVPEHSLILSTRAPIGSVAITASEACTNQGCKALVTTNKNLSLFLYYQLSSLTEQLNNIGRGSTFLELSTDDLGSFKLSIPDSDIEKIVSYLRNKTTKIDTLIQKQRQQIDLLKERRTALISAAVTGKIDLRDWMPPASSTEASPATEEATA